MSTLEFVLRRTTTSDQGTFGRLEDTMGNLICCTGELPVFGGDPTVANEKRIDCIPAGHYKATYEMSPRFGKKFYRLADVPGRSGILIHTGNFCGDATKGLKTNVEGCILLGTRLGRMQDQDCVLESQKALVKFYEITQYAPITLDIVSEY